MSEAFEAGLKELHDTGQRNVVREVIAGRLREPCERLPAVHYADRETVGLASARS